MTTAGVIAPVVLPSSADRATAHTGVESLAREPLPLPDLPPQRNVRRGLRRIRGRRPWTGRHRVVRRALGWCAGHRLDIRESAGTLTVVPDPAGGHHVTAQGHLRIPASLRRRCGLATGDRVLLAVDPDRSHLAIYPPAALDKALDPTRR